jgi:hypothetical protein
MRRRRAALTAALITLLTLLAASPAAAGGPTSALLVVPGVGTTAALYTGDADYATLAGYVGAFEPDGVAGRVDQSGAGHESGPGVTVTWLIHDVQVWRVDRIYAGADGPWISTQVLTDGSAGIWDRPVVWHAAADGKALLALLQRLGLDPSGAVSPAADSAAGAVGAPGGQPVPRDAQATAPGRAPGADPWGAGWGWGIVGLALGAAATLVAVRLAPLRARSAAQPDRQSLEDSDAWSATEGPGARIPS